MQIHFQNGYSSRVYVAIALYKTSCQPPWDSQGWWTIDPGNTVYVANTCNRYLYFYAEAVDGAYWAGPYQFEVAEGVFDFCPRPALASQARRPARGRSTTILGMSVGLGIVTRWN